MAKMREKEHLMSLITHELRTPLNAIIGAPPPLPPCTTHPEDTPGILTISRVLRRAWRLDLTDTSPPPLPFSPPCSEILTF
eukprot:135807-Prorocentrum_minimum.AAC.1